MENDVRLIKQFNKVNGEYRNPNETEHLKNVRWNNTTGYFEYTDDIYPTSVQREVGTNRMEITLSDNSKIYLSLGSLAWQSSVSSPVQSIFGRTGAVSSQNGDYTASQVTNAYNLAFHTLDDIAEGTTNLHFVQADKDEMDANTAARHSHSNKSVLDLITDAGGGVLPTAEQIVAWDAYTTLTDQQIRDVIATMIQNGTGISFAYDSVAGTLTPTVTLEPFTSDNLAGGTTNIYYSTSVVSNVKTIKLPTGDLADRIASPIELPVGWTLALGGSSVDLLVTHDLGREIADVLVWSIEPTGKVKLTGNSAYSGLTAPNDDSVLIRSIATVGFPITIELIFA